MEPKNETITSAGILVFRRNGNNIEILMGLTKYYELTKWTTLGGRKEIINGHREPDHDTAIREFNEESAGVFSELFKVKNMTNILQRSYNIVLNNGKYRLYVVDADFMNITKYFDNARDRFDEAMNNAVNLPDCWKEMISIDWIPYTILFNCSKVSRFVKYAISKNTEIIRLFNEIYIDLTVNRALEHSPNRNQPIYIKTYKNMASQMSAYLERNGYYNVIVSLKG